MTNQEYIETLDKSIRKTNRWLGVLGGLVLAGYGVTLDFISCADQLSSSPNYPTLSSAAFKVEKPQAFTGEAQPFTGTATDSGESAKVSGNMVVLEDRAHYTMQGPSVPTVAWNFDGQRSASLAFDPATQKMTLQTSAKGVLRMVSCQDEVTFDPSGVSVSQTACTMFGIGILKRAPKTADKDHYKYGAAKETITGALAQAMDMFNADLKKNSLAAGDERFDAQMRLFFVTEFANMTPTETFSVLSPLKSSPDARGVRVSGNSVTFGEATVRIHDNGAIENTQTYDDGNKTVSVIVDPNGTVQATHRYKRADSNLAFEFTHLMTPDDQTRGWVEYSNIKTDQVVKRIQLKPSILDINDMNALEYGAKMNGKAAQTMIQHSSAGSNVNMKQLRAG